MNITVGNIYLKSTNTKYTDAIGGMALVRHLDRGIPIIMRMKAPSLWRNGGLDVTGVGGRSNLRGGDDGSLTTSTISASAPPSKALSQQP